MIHKDVYRDWKNNPVTEVFFQELEDISTELEEILLDGADLTDHPAIVKQIALIRAYRSVLHYSPEFNDDGFMIDLNGDIVE